VLTDAELDACVALMDDVTPRAMERIVAERPRADQVATKKTAADWVTATDLAVERLVREEIAARFPDHRIEGEEFGVTGDENGPATWLIDPVDGTTNYVHGLPVSSFSLCVTDDAGAAAGLVADPYRRDVLSAVRGRGAHRNGRPTHVSNARSLMGGIVLTEFTAQSIWNGMVDAMQAFADAGCVTRIMGSNAFSISAVAAGRCVATAIGGFNPGDCLAGALIAAEAGAILPWGVPEEGAPFVCAAPGVVDELLSIWPAQEAA
jgi:myo-inositol-1(or 4)-monophosphatase